MSGTTASRWTLQYEATTERPPKRVPAATRSREMAPETSGDNIDPLFALCLGSLVCP
jgi:hypothetical protein